MKNILSATALTFLSVFAYAQSSNIKKINATTYSVGFNAETFRFERVVPGANNAMDISLGWAACVMMTLNYEGLNVSQSQVASSGLDHNTDEPGSPQGLMFGINRTTPANWANGKQYKIYCEANNVDQKLVFDQLAANHPLISSIRAIGGERHAVIISDMTYGVKINDKGEQTAITPQTITLHDPWPSSLASRTISWAEFMNTANTIYAIKVVPKDAGKEKVVKAK